MTTHPFEICEATLEHLDLLVPLFDGYRQFYKQPSDFVGARTFLADRITRGESVIFLAQQAGTGLGFTQLYPTFTSVSMRPAWILNDLYVVPTARHMGVGKALLERARQLGVESGAKYLMLQTAIDNFAAQRLYESLGWQRDTAFYVYELET